MKTLLLQTLSPDVIDFDFDPAEKRVGVMVVGSKALFTIEKPFIPNSEAPGGVGGGKPNVSAVPLGEYAMVQRKSPSKGLQWHFYNPALHVFLDWADMQYPWQRFSTMFHIGNYSRSVEGCCGLGVRLANFGGADGLGVSQSGAAMTYFNDFMEGETEARLIIK